MPSSPLPLPLPREELEGDLRGDGSGNSWPSSSSSSSGRTRGLRAVKTLDPVLLLSVVVLDIAELLVVEPEEEMRSWRAELIFQPCESFAATWTCFRVPPSDYRWIYHVRSKYTAVGALRPSLSHQSSKL